MAAKASRERGRHAESLRLKDIFRVSRFPNPWRGGSDRGEIATGKTVANPSTPRPRGRALDGGRNFLDRRGGLLATASLGSVLVGTRDRCVARENLGQMRTYAPSLKCATHCLVFIRSSCRCTCTTCRFEYYTLGRFTTSLPIFPPRRSLSPIHPFSVRRGSAAPRRAGSERCSSIRSPVIVI